MDIDSKNRIEYIDLKCPVCLSDNFFKLYEATLKKDEIPVIGYDFTDQGQKKTFSYSKCKKCTHIFANPRIKDLYKFYVDKIDERYTSNSKYRQLSYKNVVDIIYKFKPSGNLLDFGSGMGDFLVPAINKGYKCVGLELSNFSAEISKAKGHKIISKNLHEAENEFEIITKEKKFDIIVMMGVIEHLEYPDKDLKKINNYLKKEGLVVLWTGDSSSIYSKVLGKRWWYYIGQHIQMFSRKSLIHLFKRNNFQLIYNNNFPYVFENHYLDMHLKRYWLYKNLFRFIIYPFLSLKKIITLSLSSEILMIYKKIN